MDSKIKYFLAPTPFGNVYLCPLRDGEIYIKTDGGNYPYQRTEYEGTGEDLELTVNRVAYGISAHMRRNEEGRWIQQSGNYLTRREGYQDPSSAAVSKVSAELVPALAAWLESDDAAPLWERMAQAQREEDAAHRAALRTELARLDARRSEIVRELGQE